MAKITTIIDIGSNSIRMVVFKKTSRLGFYLINQTKQKVKISQNSYLNNNFLQKEPMDRAFFALKSFLNISKELKSRKILCVATSALRDAPNKNEFLNRVKKELKLNIKVISGEKEALFGGIATNNLLFLDNFLSVDIGGGSTEFALIKNNKIEKVVSIDIGTVRFKELFGSDYNKAKEYILDLLKKNFNEKITNLVGIGGTIRALAKAIIKKTNYPIKEVHGFRQNKEKYLDLIENILDNNLKYIKKDRFDTIKEGSFIFKVILEFFEPKDIVVSGVGVREGVFLYDLLRKDNFLFPKNFNPSVKSLLDRFEISSKQTKFLGSNSNKLFDILGKNLDIKYKDILNIASKLSPIGINLNFYLDRDNGFYFILNGLNYKLSHSDRLLIAYLIKYKNKKISNKDISYGDLPNVDIINELLKIFSINIALSKSFYFKNYQYKYNSKLYISDVDTIAKKELEKISQVYNIEFIYETSS